MRINKNQPQITQDFQLIPKTQHMNKITKYKLQDENEKLLNMLIEDEKAHCFAISFFIVKSKHIISFDSFTVGTSVINFYTKRSFPKAECRVTNSWKEEEQNRKNHSTIWHLQQTLESTPTLSCTEKSRKTCRAFR